jgi:hypothetical protein
MGGGLLEISRHILDPLMSNTPSNHEHLGLHDQKTNLNGFFRLSIDCPTFSSAANPRQKNLLKGMVRFVNESHRLPKQSINSFRAALLQELVR